jgi:orotidine-5'-phosphate decarboxylase
VSGVAAHREDRNVTFQERLSAACRANRSLLCVGLDIDTARLPAPLRTAPGGPAAFADAIIEATADLVCAYKPNLAFYLAEGLSGLGTLSAVMASIRRRAPEVPVILDAKFADIETTAVAYARFAFDVLGVDAVTVNPYLGEDALVPFLTRPDRAAFVLCKTSNPGSGDVQDLPAGEAETLYRLVARRIAAWQARYGTCGAVVGATYPEQVGEVRAILPDAPLLIPGVGAQGGAIEATVRYGLDARGGNIVVNASRTILYASSDANFAARARTAAVQLRDALEQARSEVVGAD